MKVFKVQTLQRAYLYGDCTVAYEVYAALADAGVTVQLLLMLPSGDWVPALTAN